MPKITSTPKQRWTLFDTSHPLASPLAHLSPMVPIILALIVICFPFVGPPPDSVWTIQYWGGAPLNRLAMIRNLALVVGGGIGIWLAWRRIVVSEKQVEVAMQDHNARRYENLEQRFENAISLLHNADELAQAAGVTAIEKLAIQHREEFFHRCSSLLCTYLRKNRNATDCSRDISDNQAQEVLVTLRNLARSIPDTDTTTHFDLRGVSFRNLTFINWPFDRMNLFSADFTNAKFIACHIGEGIQDARMFNTARFNDCTFDGAFYGAYFIKCIFRGCQFNDCTFYHSDFAVSRFEDCKFDQQDAQQMQRLIFRQCNISDITITQMIVAPGRSTFRAHHFAGCFVDHEYLIPQPAVDNTPRLQFDRVIMPHELPHAAQEQHDRESERIHVDVSEHVRPSPNRP